MNNEHVKVTCGNCEHSWCEKCDPAPAALCHWCHGRGHSIAPLCFEKVLMAYETCALWASTNDDGEPLDDYDLREDAHVVMLLDVVDFVTNCSDLDLTEMDAEQFGHDFWLTRNGHGAGFWDRELGELGDILTERCKPYGTCDLYVDDGGEVGVL